MELKMKSGSDISMKPDADMVMRKLVPPGLQHFRAGAITLLERGYFHPFRILFKKTWR